MSQEAFDLVVGQGYTRRYQVDLFDAEGDPYDLSNATIEFMATTVPQITKTLAIDGSGAPTGSTGISLGRPDPADHSGPLIDQTYNSGYLTIRFAPEDTAGLQPGDYAWECRIVGGGDTYPLRRGVFTITDSLFE